ncbi:MAG: nucleotidyltransferase family protein [Syntrophobacteraceae bacterium]
MGQDPTAQKLYIEWLRRAVSKGTTSALHSKRRYAWDVARSAARILRERYGATRVRAFGSILHSERFHAGSDVDLAVEGISVADYWDAVAEVFLLDETIAIDLVDPDSCSPGIWSVVEKEGVDL